ncbi:MAG: hypothetical protein HRU20_01920 [Pseudomonadales bacterium]|nr:hypothetical protein [Pseudomonadales bacterium]
MQNKNRKISAVANSNKQTCTYKTPNGAYSLDIQQAHIKVIDDRPYISIDALFDKRSMPSYVLRDVGINSYIRIDDFGVDDFNAFGDMRKTAYVN